MRTSPLLLLAACAASPEASLDPRGFRHGPSIEAVPCLLEGEWPAMGATVDDLDGDGAVDVIWAECDALAWRLADGTTERMAQPDNPAVSVYTLPHRFDPARRHVIWLGQHHIEVYDFTGGIPRRVPDALGLVHSGDELPTHLTLYDADDDGDLDVLLGRTTFGGHRREGAGGLGLLAPPKLFLSRGHVFEGTMDFEDHAVGVWHSSPTPGDLSEVMMAVDEQEVNWLLVQGRHSTPVLDTEALSPMGSAYRWNADASAWELIGSGLSRLHMLRHTDLGWFSVADAAGLNAGPLPPVTWGVLPVDADADGYEEVLFHAGLAVPFDATFGEDQLAASTDVHLDLQGGWAEPVSGLFDPTPGRHHFGGVVADLDGDLRPDILQRVVRSPDGDMPIETQLANPGARWGELRFDPTCPVIGAVLELSLSDRVERRMFHPYSQGAAFGNAPLDRTWVAVPEGEATDVRITFTDGTKWHGWAVAGAVARIHCATPSGRD